MYLPFLICLSAVAAFLGQSVSDRLFLMNSVEDKKSKASPGASTFNGVLVSLFIIVVILGTSSVGIISVPVLPLSGSQKFSYDSGQVCCQCLHLHRRKAG